jgi:hypothetical protein
MAARQGQLLRKTHPCGNTLKAIKKFEKNFPAPQPFLSEAVDIPTKQP